MKLLKLYYIIISAPFIFVTSVDCHANEIEKKFVDAGLIDIHAIDKSIKVDLSEAQKHNRELLSNAMKKAGFFPLSYEWWHFNGMKKGEARKTYQIIE